MIDINMPQLVMAAWLNALRSGNFKRGKEYLKFESAFSDEEPTYCCLGVLNEVTGADAGNEDEELLIDDTFGLSRGLQSWLAEINDTTCRGFVDDGATSIPINDILIPNAKFPNSLCRAPEGLPPFKVDWSKINTFEQIADYIEANLNPIGKETP
jgi:hypothetical protein